MSTTYTATGTYSLKAVCTTGSETAPTTSATAGFDCVAGPGGNAKGIRRLTVSVFPTTGGTALTAGTLDLYAFDPIQAAWQRVYSADGVAQSLTVPGSLANDIGVMFQGFETNNVSRFTAVPTGLGVACTVVFQGSPVEF